MSRDEPLDLSPIDPEEDPHRLSRVVEGVLDRLGPGIVHTPPPLRLQIARHLSDHFRPAFAAASVIAIVAAVALTARPPTPVATGPGGAAEGVAQDWGAWLTQEPTPRAEELLFALAGGNQ